MRWGFIYIIYQMKEIRSFVVGFVQICFSAAAIALSVYNENFEGFFVFTLGVRLISPWYNFALFYRSRTARREISNDQYLLYTCYWKFIMCINCMAYIYSWTKGGRLHTIFIVLQWALLNIEYSIIMVSIVQLIITVTVCV